MSKIDNGGRVYPTHGERYIKVDDAWCTRPVEAPGITRRNELADKIAAQLYGAIDHVFFSARITAAQFEEINGAVPKMAYKRADAMIAEGRKGEE